MTAPTTPPPAQPAPISIRWKLWGTGWATARVQHAKVRHEMHVSYATDALGDLVKTTLELLEEGSQMEVYPEKGEPTLEPLSMNFAWEDEPGIWFWTLTYVNARTLGVRLRVSEKDRHELAQNDDAKVAIETNQDSRQWCEMVLAMLEGVLAKHGLSGYRETWVDEEFPVGLYLRLLSHRTRQFRLGRSRSIAGVRRTRLADELATLKRLASRKPARKRRTKRPR